MTKRKTKIGYKIFKLHKGKLASWNGHPGSILYDNKKRTYREIFSGAICLFSELSKAREFLEIFDSGAEGAVILRVKYRPSKIHDAYDRFKKHASRRYLRNTVFADWIKIKWQSLSSGHCRALIQRQEL